MDGATQIPISEIEASTTQEFVSCTFRSVNSKAAYFISANNCSRSHINFGQTGGDLSFGVPYPFQRHWPHGVFHQKMRRSRNLQFLCSLFLSFGFFLTSTCPPPALCCKELRSFNSALVPLEKQSFKNCWILRTSANRSSAAVFVFESTPST